MNLYNEKYEICRHSTGRIGELVVYVHNTCPNKTKIGSSLVSSKIRCRECKDFENAFGTGEKKDNE